VTAPDVARTDRTAGSRSRLIAAVITGTYSWALTVLPPAVSGSSSFSLAAVAAAIAILSLLSAPLLPPGRPALIAALDVFVGFCILSWWAGRPNGINPPFAVFGSFGWLAYTLALGSLSTPGQEATAADPGPHLDPRTPPSRLAAGALLLVLLASLALLGAAWKVERPAVSVLAHVFALSAVLVLLRSGALLSTFLQVRGTKLARAPRLARAAWPLFGLFALLAVAAAWFLSGA
jgi:hypothetical protein